MLANDRTIGSGGSGATERANADCKDLFVHLWAGDPDLEVSGGRGVSAESDWAADKTISLPDFRNRAFVGFGNMGNVDAELINASLFTAGDNTTLGSIVGAERYTLTVAQLPSHTHSVTGSTNTAGNHSHSYVRNGSTVTGSGSGANLWTGTSSSSTSSAGSHSHSVSGTAQSTGSGNPHSSMQPSKLVTIYIKF